MYVPSVIRSTKNRLLLGLAKITKEEQSDTALHVGPLGVWIEVNKHYDAKEFGVSPGDFIWTDGDKDEMAVCVGVNGRDPYVLTQNDLRHVAPLYKRGQTRYPEAEIFRVPSEEEIVAQENKVKELEKITVSQAVLEALVEMFDEEDELFVDKALELRRLPFLDAISEAATAEEAEAEHFEAGNCCDDEERAVFRRWLELIDKQEDVLEIYSRISCEDGDSEKMLCIRKMAVILSWEDQSGV